MTLMTLRNWAPPNLWSWTDIENLLYFKKTGWSFCGNKSCASVKCRLMQYVCIRQLPLQLNMHCKVQNVSVHRPSSHTYDVLTVSSQKQFPVVAEFIGTIDTIPFIPFIPNWGMFFCFQLSDIMWKNPDVWWLTVRPRSTPWDLILFFPEVLIWDAQSNH